MEVSVKRPVIPGYDNDGDLICFTPCEELFEARIQLDV